MNNSLKRLIYISHNQITGNDTEVRREIDNILETARQANSALGITGVLMYNKGCFAQVLEGCQQVLENTFEQILCDKRHSEVVILSFESIETRGFSSWSMGYVGDDPHVEAQFDSIRSSSGFDPEKIPSDAIYSLLRQNLIEAEGRVATSSTQKAA